MDILRQLAKELAPLLAPLVADQLRGAPVADGWVPQKGSKLGRNNHIEAVRRVQSEDGDSTRAVTRGKLHLLRKDAYDAELMRAGRPLPVKTRAADPGDGDLAARFRKRLGVR